MNADRMIRVLAAGGCALALAVSIGTTGCAREKPATSSEDAGPKAGSPDSSAEPTILFEVAVENHAWGRVIKGWYVDDQGGVYTYDHSSADWSADSTGTLTAAALEEKFASRQRVGEVPSDSLQMMRAHIEPARSGPFSEPVSRCRDAGIQAYLAYQYDPPTGAYHSILLYQAGDHALKNLSESAKVLSEWLFTLSGGKPSTCTPEGT